jgi:hypothetical protein
MSSADHRPRPASSPAGPASRSASPASSPAGPAPRSASPAPSPNPEISPDGRYVRLWPGVWQPHIRVGRARRACWAPPRGVQLPHWRQAGRGALHDREDFIFREDLMYLYDEKFSPGIKSSGSWCPYGCYGRNVAVALAIGHSRAGRSGASLGRRVGRWRAGGRELSDITEMSRRSGAAKRPAESRVVRASGNRSLA